MSNFSRWDMGVLLMLCLACVSYQAMHHAIGFYGAESDLYSFYAPTAQALHDGEVNIDDFHPPLYGWILGLLTYIPLFPGAFEAGIFLSLLSYLAVIIATMLMAWEASNRNLQIALIAAALVAANPTLSDQACRATVHVFFLAISLWSIYFALRQKALLAGLFVGVALWTRCTWALSLIPLIFLRGKPAWRGWVVAASAWIGLGLLTHAYKGTWFYELNKLNFAAGLYNTETYTNAGLWVRQHQQQFAPLSIMQIALYDVHKTMSSVWTHLTEFSGKILMSLVLPPLGIFALFGWRRMGWKAVRQNPLIAWTVAAFAILVASYWAPQYVMGFVPLLSMGAALQIVEWPALQKFKQGPRLIVYAAAALGMTLMLGSFEEGPRDVKRAALLLKEMPGEGVAARDPRVFYYSGKKPAELTMRKDGSIFLTGDFMFYSKYEGLANDTLQKLIKDPAFVKDFQVTGFPGAVIFRRLPGESLGADSTKAD